MDWPEMYRLELGIDLAIGTSFDRRDEDIAAAHQGDTAARRRVAAYYRAQRAFDRQVEAEEPEAAEG